MVKLAQSEQEGGNNADVIYVYRDDPQLASSAFKNQSTKYIDPASMISPQENQLLNSEQQ